MGSSWSSTPPFLGSSTCGDEIMSSKKFFGSPSKTIDLGLFDDLDHLYARDIFI